MAFASQAHAVKWLRLTSGHFDMLSCTNERDSKQMLVELEQFRAFFFTLFPAGRAHDMRPLIIVFNTRRQIEDYSPLQSACNCGGLPGAKFGIGLKPTEPQPSSQQVKKINGVFLPGLLENRIAMVNDQIEQGLRTIFHEYVHALARARMPGKIPIWFNEGLAEVYSSFEARGDNIKFGLAHEGHVLRLRRTPLIPLNTFFAVDASSKYYNENDKMNIFYAQAWLMMHFILCGKNDAAITSKNLQKFITMYDRPDIPAQTAFEESFGMSYKNLERLLNGYLNSGKYTTVSTKLSANPFKEKITCRPATDMERDMELESLRRRVRNDANAEYKLLQMHEKYPDDPRICEIFAEIKMSERNMDAAANYRRKAIEKNTQNALVYVWHLRDEFRGSNYPLDYILPDERCAEYRRLVDKALELAPDCMEAYELLATVESLSAKMRIPEINTVLQALQHMREKSKTYLALATAYWRLKRYNDAEAVIAVLSKDPKTTSNEKRRAHEILRRIAKETGKPPPPPLPGKTPARKIPKNSPLKPSSGPAQ